MAALIVATLKQSASQPTKVGPARWDVIANGKRIVSASTDPERAACRALRARAVAETVRFQHETGVAGLEIDIDVGAGLPRLKKISRQVGEPAGQVAEPKPKAGASKSGDRTMPEPGSPVHRGGGK